MRIVTAGDSAIVVEFEERIDPSINAQAIALADAIQAAAIAGVRDIVPTFRSVAIYFDPLRTDYDGLLGRIELEGARPRPIARSSPPAVRSRPASSTHTRTTTAPCSAARNACCARCPRA